ncbi:uncharacterized protein LOC124278880 isoform X2 [Haliotis rubra]|uniref:uncharacterized protein LOC124278880 isoform X2 n=1 Tax=Haliotis rubra TaxID=36100 RepID=UPI001EE5608F|nr:uncharacterized protein LOC124278880 isoform X2 [Haliotis rubra]
MVHWCYTCFHVRCGSNPISRKFRLPGTAARFKRGLYGNDSENRLQLKFLGGFSVVWCPMLVRLFGLENLPKFLGGQLLMQGIGSLCGPPLQSYLADVFGHKEVIFYITGASFISSILVVLPFLLRRQRGSRHRDDPAVTGVTNQAVELDSIDSPV